MELLRIEPGSPDYPEHVLRKALFQIKGVGWEVAGSLAKRFRTMESAMAVSQKDWEDDRIGAVRAKRIYETLHGHPDPRSVKKQRKAATKTLTLPVEVCDTKQQEAT